MASACLLCQARARIARLRAAAARWPEIMAANRGLIRRPEALRVGQEIVIPCPAGPEQRREVLRLRRPGCNETSCGTVAIFPRVLPMGGSALNSVLLHRALVGMLR